MLSVSLGEHGVVSREGVREPQLLRLRNGDLVLTYHVQPDRHFAHRRSLRSTDNGASWAPMPRRAHREQAIGQGDGGTVLAFDIYTFEREPGVYVGSFFRSDDDGATFTGPHETVVRVNRVFPRQYPTPEHFPSPDHVMRKFYQPLPEYYAATVSNASRLLGPSFWRYMIEHDGRWLAPMQGRFHGDRPYRTILVASDDGGRSWDFVTTIAYDHEEQRDGYCEPALAVAADGSLLCVLRRGGHLPMGQCRSLDGGATWSAPEFVAGHGVDPDLLLLSNGVLACTYGRPGLHIMFSEDGCGYGWGYRTMIGEWPSSTYMGIAEVSPGKLLLVYDRRDAAPAPGAEPDPNDTWIGATTVRVEAMG